MTIPCNPNWGHDYSFGTRGRSLSNGIFIAPEFGKKLQGTAFVEVIGEGKENARWKLTDKGREYAHWLVKNGKKDEFLKTPFGGWGVPFTFEEARRQANH